MNSSQISPIKKSDFSKYLISANALNENGFKEWIFCPGMLFNSTEKWWGDYGRRNRPHEGLDLLLYRDRHDKVYHLDHKTKIPSMYEGVVFNIINDFLGRSIFMEHSFTDRNNSRLCTFYGHTKPLYSLSVGDSVKEGDIISTLADTGKSKSGISSHLHISLAFVPQNISLNQMNWDIIGNPSFMTLLNPIDCIDWHYRLLNRDLPRCNNFQHLI